MPDPPRERSLYEIASIFFAVVVIVFALGGMLTVALGNEGIASGAFLICTLFLLLGIGRLYLGARRGSGRSAEEDSPGSEEAAASPRPVRRPPIRRRRP